MPIFGLSDITFFSFIFSFFLMSFWAKIDLFDLAAVKSALFVSLLLLGFVALK